MTIYNIVLGYDKYNFKGLDEIETALNSLLTEKLNYKFTRLELDPDATETAVQELASKVDALNPPAIIFCRPIGLLERGEDKKIWVRFFQPYKGVVVINYLDPREVDLNNIIDSKERLRNAGVSWLKILNPLSIPHTVINFLSIMDITPQNLDDLQYIVMKPTAFSQPPKPNSSLATKLIAAIMILGTLILLVKKTNLVTSLSSLKTKATANPVASVFLFLGFLFLTRVCRQNFKGPSRIA